MDLSGIRVSIVGTETDDLTDSTGVFELDSEAPGGIVDSMSRTGEGVRPCGACRSALAVESW